MKLLGRFEEAFCGTALLATTVILFINVVLRYVFKASTSWAEEVIKYLMIWITFIGGSICVRRGAHVSIDFFMAYLSEKMRKAVSALVFVVSICFTLTMTYYGVTVISFTIKTAQVSPALQIPMWIPYLSVPFGFSLMSLRLIQEFIKLIRKWDISAGGDGASC